MVASTGTSYGGHSAKVKMTLLISGNANKVAQMGRDFIFIDKPFDHPPCDAEMVLQVDQSERRWAVKLPQGISANSKRVEVAAN